MKNVFFAIVLTLSTMAYGQKEMYELRVYELSFGKPAKTLYNYIENALIPALNRQGINNIGVFDEVGDAMPKKIYLFIPFDDVHFYSRSIIELKEDKAYQKAAEVYMNTPKEKFPIQRYTTSTFIAFDGLPKMNKAAKGSMIFELRTYEAYNEDALQRKIKMFNESEFKIFDEVGLHTVFFGEKISGPDMPCLTYMIAFKDMDERNENWKKFGPHPEWQRIVGLSEYANTVSNISRVFLKPFKFSQL